MSNNIAPDEKRKVEIEYLKYLYNYAFEKYYDSTKKPMSFDDFVKYLQSH